METKIRKEKTDYPLMLEPKHIQEIMDISRKNTYLFLGKVEVEIKKNKNPFPIKRFGKLLKIPRDQFFEWAENCDNYYF